MKLFFLKYLDVLFSLIGLFISLIRPFLLIIWPFIKELGFSSQNYRMFSSHKFGPFFSLIGLFFLKVMGSSSGPSWGKPRRWSSGLAGRRRTTLTLGKV